MPHFYESGEAIRKGDRILFHGEPGEIEFVADASVGDGETAWYVETFGSGVMVREPKHFGSAFLSEPERAGDLVFVARAQAGDGG